MARGRPINQLRNAALALGQRTYSDPERVCICGCEDRYSINAQCVACTIDRAKNRYVGLDAAALTELKAKDKARYHARLQRESKRRGA